MEQWRGIEDKEGARHRVSAVDGDVELRALVERAERDPKTLRLLEEDSGG